MECEKTVSVRVTTVARDLAKYKLDAVDVQDVRWDKENAVRAGDYTKVKSSIGNRFFFCTPQNITSS